MNNKGAGLIIFVLVILLGLSGIVFAFLAMLSDEMKNTNAELLSMRAFYIAEAGRAKARWALITDAQGVGWGESNVAFGGGTYTVTTAYSDAPTNQHVTITSTGYIPDSTNPLVQRTVVETGVPYDTGEMNLLSGSASVASASQGNNDPEQVLDGSYNPGWISAVKEHAWLVLDYGSDKTVGKVIIYGSKITSIVLLYSLDGINWVPVPDPSGALPGTQTFSPVTARYMKLDITSGSSEKAQVDEVEAYGGSSTGGTAHLGKGSFSTSQ